MGNVIQKLERLAFSLWSYSAQQPIQSPPLMKGRESRPGPGGRPLMKPSLPRSFPLMSSSSLERLPRSSGFILTPRGTSFVPSHLIGRHPKALKKEATWLVEEETCLHCLMNFCMWSTPCLCIKDSTTFTPVKPSKIVRPDSSATFKLILFN